jgi:hypothetical protein
MIWATFEHVNNTPAAKYDYVAQIKDQTKQATQPQPSGGTWLFSADAAATDVNKKRMFLNPTNEIHAGNSPGNESGTIGPSNLLRINPWGSDRPAETQLSFFKARRNTDVISLNNSLINWLAPGDARKNYLLIGSTWTVRGIPPDRQDGSSLLANTTMETFQQTTRNGCFGCHRGDQTMLGLPNGRGLSRIWGRLTPLFPAP